ncbi:unnamed protein product [Heligmosomoides polygyrus]|uniref:Ricin B-type lectin domain-containing protein n=1 Tax=Heligmosomoides polygyrus TaxID=6339 RepID=A0A3P8B7Y6_HELPZ|nr:unnamed protein product [Heligmosomoides polygyrus]
MKARPDNNSGSLEPCEEETNAVVLECVRSASPCNIVAALDQREVWKVVKLLSRGTRYAQPFPVTIDLGEEVSVGSSTICGDQAQALQYILVDCTGGQPSGWT